MEYLYFRNPVWYSVMGDVTPNLSQDKSWFNLSMIWLFSVPIIKKLLALPGISRNKGIDVDFVTLTRTMN